jgi:hypothetical protein
MQKRLFSLILFFLCTAKVLASGDPLPAGGRTWGIGNTAVTLTDSWSLFNNPAGISGQKQLTIICTYDNRFGMPGMQSFATGMVLPLKYGSVGIHVSRFGDELYSEHFAGVAYSHQISKVQLGMKANYVQIGAGDLGARRTFTFQFGGIAAITPQISFGAHIYNFNQARLAEYQDERIPTVMKAGLSYKPFTKLMLNLETEKDIDYPATVKAGIEYQIVSHLFLRTGITSKPFVNHFGIGLSRKHFQFDYALRTHPVLGFSHHLSLAYSFEKNKKDV